MKRQPTRFQVPKDSGGTKVQSYRDATSGWTRIVVCDCTTIYVCVIAQHYISLERLSSNIASGHSVQPIVLLKCYKPPAPKSDNHIHHLFYNIQHTHSWKEKRIWYSEMWVRAQHSTAQQSALKNKAEYTFVRCGGHVRAGSSDAFIHSTDAKDLLNPSACIT